MTWVIVICLAVLLLVLLKALARFVREARRRRIQGRM